MDLPLRKATARLDVKAAPFTSRPPSPAKHSPTSSPSPSTFRPRAKVNTATVRTLSSSSSLHSSSHSNNVPLPSRSRPGSPFKHPRVVQNGSEPSSSPRARVMARPTSRSEMGPVPNILEPRQRALTTASAKLKFPHPEDRPRSGSVIALHHALSISDINASSVPTPSQPLSLAEHPLVPIKVKSKVTGVVKAMSTNPGDAISRSLSPPYATTRPIHARARAPSITSSFSPIDPPPSSFYPITTASPAANPHRYTPRRAQSPVHFYTPPTLSSEPHPARRSLLAPKVDPASVPLPPHSPPISALSLSSKSSLSRTSTSLDTDQTTDNQTSTIVSHVKHQSIERAGRRNPFFSQADIKVQTRRNRSRSKERDPHLVARGESDAEPYGPERQLKAEAKTNRKIADLEITNRSLLAINASLESTKHRQAKEIRSLRRKLRESRLILPPRTYRAVKSALEDERDRDVDEADEDSDVEEETDEIFQRVRGLIENLLESGKRALETRPEDFRTSLATKVLNADELRSWRGSGQRTDTQDANDKTMHGLSSVAVPGSDTTSSVESDGEPASDSQGPSALPPTLTITHSL